MDQYERFGEAVNEFLLLCAHELGIDRAVEWLNTKINTVTKWWEMNRRI